MDSCDTRALEHQHYRSLIKAIRQHAGAGTEAGPYGRGSVPALPVPALPVPAPSLEQQLQELQTLLRAHFSQEETYYRLADADEGRFPAGLIHQLRNDHAAMLFGMESLLIRLRKKGAIPEWWLLFDKLMAIFLPHMDQEEKLIFPHLEKRTDH